MDTNIKPIETIYKGYRFRSRLEARWAVFFDACGVEWEYEPEGFDLGDGICYLPDFLLHGVKAKGFSGDLYVEIKGCFTVEDRVKLHRFYNVFSEMDELPVSKKPLFVVGDIPYEGDTDLTYLFYVLEEKLEDDNNIDRCNYNTYKYIFGNICAIIQGLFCIDNKNRFCLNVDHLCHYVNEGATLEAYRIAKQVRFEHGEAAEIPAIISDFRERFNLGR